MSTTELNNDSEIRFFLPIEFNGNIELHEFSSGEEENKYLLCFERARFVISESLFHLMSSIEGANSIEEIHSRFNLESDREAGPGDIVKMINTYLVPYGVIKSNEEFKKKPNASFLKLKTTILNEQLVNKLSDLFRNLFFPSIAWTLVSITVGVHVFLLLNHYSISDLSVFLNNPISLLICLLLLLVSILFHELGHSSACKYFGANPGEIGIGIYIYFIVFYADINDSWRLNSKQRSIVDVGGIYFQSVFNLIIAILFLITKDDLYLSIIVIILFQILFTLNPFLRYDGYWLTSDLLGIPNLRAKSTQYIRRLINKHVFKAKTEAVLPRVKPLSKLVFIIYSTISNLFLLCFFYFIIKIIPNRIISFPRACRDYVDTLNYSFTIRDWSSISLSTYQIFMQLAMVVLGCYFIFMFSKKLFSIISGLFRKKNLDETIILH